MEARKNVLLIFLVLLFVWWLMKPSSEGFNPDTDEFVPVGHRRYGLRGDVLRRSDIARLYIRPDRQIRLNPTSGWMYESNNTPCREGIGGCRKMPCPTNTNEYDKLDTCWNCGTADYAPMKIPPIHPHVPN